MNNICEEISEKDIDILDRQQFVDRIVEIIDMLSAKENSSSFAIDGKWGCGKSWVLSRLEEQIADKYIVFHYNCWENDFYSEPLMAIVINLAQQLDKHKETLEKCLNISKTAIKEAADLLLDVFGQLSKSTVGVDVPGLVKKGFSGFKKVKQANKTSIDFDEYFSLKKVIAAIKEAINKLTVSHTIVFVVDELDRCLPEYAIKVLERLHHVFSGQEKTLVILGVDNSQLENTVKYIFGRNTETQDYLKKFIDFSVSLDLGKANYLFQKKYWEYLAFFNGDHSDRKISYEELLPIIFSGIDIRTQENIIEKAKVIHRLVFEKKQQSLSVMCVELIWLVFNKYHQTGDILNRDEFLMKSISDNNVKTKINRIYSTLEAIPKNIIVSRNGNLQGLDQKSIYHMIIWYYSCCIEKAKEPSEYPNKLFSGNFVVENANLKVCSQCMKQFADLAEIIS